METQAEWARAALTDHPAGAAPAGANKLHRPLVALSRDHPGFSDPEYRRRRDLIARLALDYEPGAPLPDAPYSEEEHGLWRLVREALGPRHERHACAEYLDCVRRLGLPRERIPQLREVSAKVEGLSGFRLEPVAGLVEPHVFLGSLERGVFLCTQYIRHHSAPFYTPEPDVVHELAGHAVLLASERAAEVNRLFGEAVRRARTPESLARLSRLYWFTVEFGVVREGGRVKAFGAGLLSSAGELERMGRAELRPLDPEEASRLDYDPTAYQPVLFCADSFDAMSRTLREHLAGWR